MTNRRGFLRGVLASFALATGLARSEIEVIDEDGRDALGKWLGSIEGRPFSIAAAGGGHATYDGSTLVIVSATWWESAEGEDS